MRKILAEWDASRVFVADIVHAANGEIGAEIEIEGDEGDYRITVTRPETDAEKAERQNSAERQRKLDAIAAREVELLQYEMLKGKYGG